MLQTKNIPWKAKFREANNTARDQDRKGFPIHPFDIIMSSIRRSLIPTTQYDVGNTVGVSGPVRGLYKRG
jgi:hypothetical protein